MKRIFKRVWFWILVIVVLGGIGAVLAFATGGDDQEILSTLVTKGELVQTVESSGTIESDREIVMAFEVTGIVSEINFEPGDEVIAGDILMSLHSAEAQYNLAKAQATLAAAEANLSQKVAGETDETIGVSEAQLTEAQALLAKYEQDYTSAQTDYDNTVTQYTATVAKAEVALADAEDDLANTLDDNELDLIAVYDDTLGVMQDGAIAVAGALSEADKILGIDDTNVNDEFEYLLSVHNEQYLIDAEASYPVARDALLEVEDLLEGLSTDSADEDIEAAIDEVRDMLEITLECLNDTRHVLDATISGSTDLTATELNTFKSTIDTERTAVNTASTNLTNQEQAIDAAVVAAQTAEDTAQNAYDSAVKALAEAEASQETQVALADAAVDTAEVQVAVQEASIATAEANVALKTASPRSVDLAALYAAVDEAGAALALAEIQYEKYQIRAPFDGQFTDYHFELGELVAAGTTAAEMLSKGSFQIVTEIDETDIVKVELNDIAEITFDALGDDLIFEGYVAKINPAETVVEGVVSYQVTVYLDEVDERVRSGMSTDVIILTEQIVDALIVPNRAILIDNLVKYVRIVEGGQVRDREVEVGIRGDGGQTQILSGAKEGEEVVITIRDGK